jgi:Sodium:dicarboxylate symporter family
LPIETHVTLADKPRPRNNITLLVFVAIAAAVVLGIFDASLALKMNPLGDLFIKLIRMTIGPIVFLCVATGVAHIGDLRKAGRIGLKALIYFELVTTLALAIGLASVTIFKPGVGVTALPSASAAGDYAAYATKGKAFSFLEFVMGTVPDNFFGAFVKGDLLQVVVIGLLVGMVLIAMGSRGHPVVRALDSAMNVFFGMIRIIMRVAPIRPGRRLSFCNQRQASESGLRPGEVQKHDFRVFLHSFKDNFVAIWGDVEVAYVEVGSEVGQLPLGACLQVDPPEILMLNLSSQEHECSSPR